MFLLLYCCIFSSILVLVAGNNDMGPGIWTMKSVKKHEEENGESYNLEMNFVKRKLNRTHDAYNGTYELKNDFDNNTGIRLDVHKCVDGGCKPYVLITDQSLPNFLKKHAKKNYENFLTNAKVHPPDFPIKAGTYKVCNYMIDCCSLPPQCFYGLYILYACSYKNGKPNACIDVVMECTRDDDDTCGERNDE